MARYAEWNSFIQNLKTDIWGVTNVNEVGIAFDKAKADVVPKSEVEKMENAYYRATRKANKNAITAIQNAKQEVAREIFEEIESISSDFPIYGNVNTVILSERDLAFIKKKYTEGKDEQASIQTDHKEEFKK